MCVCRGVAGVGERRCRNLALLAGGEEAEEEETEEGEGEGWRLERAMMDGWVTGGRREGGARKAQVS
ncbi:hypothetical protein Dda_1814 [Drechslerella dactyloides]|uniref:Uncharacterized protein n=1 Tax=Drechslerella dactyloides TaxID=74499 RepID=A0AAD6J2L7_DREDA|nr:hypothetical protein Dda_1814 [Drechslerella dactyloides]